MLEEGRTTVRVKALLEDTFRPNYAFALTAVYLCVTADMAKDIKELSFDTTMISPTTQATEAYRLSR